MNALEHDRVSLRAMELSDLDLLYKWENDPAIWKVSNTIAPFSKYILQKYIESSHRDIYQNRQLRLMIDIKGNKDTLGETIGMIDLFDFDPFHYRAGLGILISEEEHRQKGYAREALEIMVDYAFHTLHLHQLYCNISKGNEASLKLFKGKGFLLAGTKKDWLRTREGWEDEYILQLIKEA
jgi:diamine N-acetyltransferase